MVAARGCEWMMSPLSNKVTAMPARPSIKATMSPTGPPPATMTAALPSRPRMRERGEESRGADGIDTEDLFGGNRGIGRHDFLHGADPTRVGQIENHPVRVLVFDLIIGVRVVVGAAHVVGAARRDHFPGRVIEIVDPHAEMNEAIM